MQITFLTRKSALIYRLRQRVASLTLICNGDFAIRAYGTSFDQSCHQVNVACLRDGVAVLGLMGGGRGGAGGGELWNSFSVKVQ